VAGSGPDSKRRQVVGWDSSYKVGSLNLFRIFNSANFALGLGLIHYLRKSARATFVHFRPFLPLNKASNTATI